MFNRRLAGLTGLAYLALILSGLFAQFFVRAQLWVPGDAAATAERILASEFLFRLGFASDLIMICCDVLVALALLVLLRSIRRELAGLAAVFRLLQAGILGLNLLNHFLILTLLSGADYLQAFTPEQIQALVHLLLEAHSFGYLIAQVFFGLHCLLLGHLLALAARSFALPLWIARLMQVAGLAYLLESALTFLAPSAVALAYPGLALAILGEAALTVWLLRQGLKSRAVSSEGEVSIGVI